MDRIKYIINILIVALLFAAIAINKDGKLLGTPVTELVASGDESAPTETPIETILADGTRVINSTSLAKDIQGFGGLTPVKLYIKDDIITKVEYLENSESPSFFQQLIDGNLFSSWDNLPITEAANARVDIVTGATYSSKAIIDNVQRAAAYAANIDESPSASNPFADISLKTIIGILVILTGITITLVKPKSKIFETTQLILNVLVLGFWCGSFLSLTQFVAWLANGFNLSLTILAIMLLAVVIIMPLLGHKGTYCHIHCPMGSLQILLNRVPNRKIQIGAKTNKILNQLRYYILLALLLFMWIGFGFDLMNYEIFPAFLISSASTTVLIMAAIFIILSLFTSRPYCRFVCPTGAILTIMQKDNK